jgi:hypothetical protein
MTWKTGIGLAAILIGVAFINKRETADSFSRLRSPSITNNVIAGSAPAGQG